MSLLDAAESLDHMASGRLPTSKRVLLGLNSLDTMLLQGGCEQALHDAAAALELFVAAGGLAHKSAEARSRYGLLAAAVRRPMPNGWATAQGVNEPP